MRCMGSPLTRTGNGRGAFYPRGAGLPAKLTSRACAGIVRAAPPFARPTETDMAHPPEVTNMALFCDFENIALGVRDARYDKFDIAKVLERLLLKGSIVVKKAYCDWDRYKAFKAPMHEASFELIEIPHVRQSGKNSADIRMVVDALDLCYTKSHVDTFVIISGDSDFSPLVSKLRENDKTVIGVGVKRSTSDLFISNCDEFIYYDDLVRVEPAKKRPSVAATEPTEKTGKDHRPSIDGALDLMSKNLESLSVVRCEEYAYLIILR